MRFFFACLAALPLVACQVPIPYTNCGKAGDLLTVYNVTANVWPPVKGKEFDVSVNADLSKDINGGSYHAKLVFDYLPILDKSGPFTDLNVTLPIKGGPISLTKGLTFPTSVPAGYVDITVSGVDEAGTEIACFEIKANLAASSSSSSSSSSERVIDYLPGLANTNVPFSSCGGSGDVVTVSSIAADVWPPVKGQNVTLFISADASATIASGNYDAAVSFDGIKIDDEKGSLASLGLPLPIAAGPLVAKKTLSVPGFAPSGSVNVKATATDGDNKELFCVSIDTQI